MKDKIRMSAKIAGFIMMLSLTLVFAGSSVRASEWSEVAVTIDGEEMTLTSDYDSALVPEGFTETLLIYNDGQYYGCLDSETQSQKMFYIRCDSDKAKTGWYELGSDNQTFTKYDPSAVDLPDDFGETEPGTLKIAEMTLHISDAPESEKLPEQYVETNMAGDANLVKAFQIKDAKGNDAEMYIVYGTLDSYNYSWYCYDMRDGTVQRFFPDNSEIATQQEENITELQNKLTELNDRYNHDVGRSKNLFLISLILTVLFFFLMLNAIIKRRHTTLDLEDRIIDLKNHGGQETQVYSGRDRRINAKLDKAALSRSHTYRDEPIGSEQEDPDEEESSWYRELDGAVASGERRGAFDLDAKDEDESLYEAFDATMERRSSGKFGRRKKNEQEDPWASAPKTSASGTSAPKASAHGAPDSGKNPAQSRQAASGRPMPARSAAERDTERRQAAVKKSSLNERRQEMQNADSRPMPEDGYRTTKIKDRAAANAAGRRESLSGTQPILDSETKRRIREKAQERSLTMAAAGDADDFDLAALERSLGEHAESAINTPSRTRISQVKYSKGDIRELQNRNDDIDFIDL